MKDNLKTVLVVVAAMAVIYRVRDLRRLITDSY